MFTTLVALLALVTSTPLQSQPAGDPTPPIPNRGEAAPAPAEDPANIPTVRLDPEHPFPIIGWWTNGTEMIQLSEDSAYKLYDSSNRYRKPIEVGRWHRQNHAAFWLEPYTMRKDDRTRVPLSIANNQVVIAVRKYKAMTHVEQPPMVAEDLFLGLWAGEGGTLELQSTMRYHYVAPRSAAEGQPIVISSHRGEWRLREGRIELLPDSPSVTAMILEPESVEPEAKQPTASKSKPSGAGAAGHEIGTKTGTKTGTKADTQADTRAAASVEEGATSINRLRSVEGTLDRIVERPAVGPNDQRQRESAPSTSREAVQKTS
jgi:hypothetical protein